MPARLIIALAAALLAAVLAANAHAARRSCFGAAARDPEHPCASASLRLSVVPSPAVAPTLPNSPCRPAGDDPPICAFGAPADTASDTIALVGDSHAGHWRGALTVVARAFNWHGLSITHTSCPLQKALRDLPEPRRTQCRTWKQEVFAWFAVHPEIHTVFVAGLSGGSSVVPSGGMSRFQSSVAGYVDAWNALPASVQRIVVIRDTPKARPDTNDCVAREVARHHPPAAACAVPRSRALDPDPAIAAAARMPPGRVQTVDLTRYFCGPRDCYPVIGGVLVLRDNTHLTGAFSQTLGPYLQRAVTGVLSRFTAASR